MESYTVKFWLTNKEGFKEQKEEVVHFASGRRTSHEAARKKVMSKYKSKNPEIISVRFQ